jgi:hypothetical protein
MEIPNPMKHLILVLWNSLVVFLLFQNPGISAQTLPVPFQLSSGNFQFNYWDSLNMPGTYPANMIFQFVPSNQLAPYYHDSTNDFSCSYNLTKRPRFIGYGNKGVAFLTTSNSQYNDCNSGASDHRFVGNALLALNSTNRTNIRVQWKSETLIPGDGNGIATEARVMRLRLQYRIGSTGQFTDVPGPVEFTSGMLSGDSLSFGPTVLPAECTNKPVIQLRWIYFETYAGNGGTRPRLRLDDILVQSDAQVGYPELTVDHFDIVPNPANENFNITGNLTFESRISIFDSRGYQVQESLFRNSSQTFDCSKLNPGIYIVRFTDMRTGYSVSKKLLIRR